MSRARVYNAAGPRSKELADLRKLLATSVPVIQVGSVSVHASEGNTYKRYFEDATTGTTLNSFGLPNRGLAYYEKELPAFIQKAHRLRKKVRVNIVGSRPKEYGVLARTFARIGVDEIEINAGCPNVWKGGKQKRIPAFDLQLLEAIVDEATAAGGKVRYDVKLSPYSDPELLRQVARLLGRKRRLTGVVLCNTFPNAYAAKAGLAGLGGGAFHHIVLGQVYQFRDLLPRRMKVVGLGGARNSETVRNFLKAGADEVQVGSYYHSRGPSVFRNL